ncbi:unnamed protein product [Haemonchus placei]|uniref:DB domain-containing protein n=1 Tax=Haemonchus placei TaxID=6290 RepID=A0A0N4WH46_HAEPC|nr:unnamed protein product [Haemonchus placei]
MAFFKSSSSRQFIWMSSELANSTSVSSTLLSRSKRQCCAACTTDSCSCGGCPAQLLLPKQPQVVCPERCQPMCTNACVMETVTCPSRCQPLCTSTCIMALPSVPAPVVQCTPQCMPYCEPSCVNSPMIAQPMCESRCMPSCSPQCVQTYQVQQTCVQECMPTCQPTCIRAMEVRQITTTTCVEACRPLCQPSCIQAVTCSTCMNDCPAMCGQPVCVNACMPRCLPTCIQAMQVQTRPVPMVPCSPGCAPPSCSPLCMQQSCPQQCMPSCTPSCIQQFATQLSPTKTCATECMPSCEASCLAQVTCAPTCMPACAPSCVALHQPALPPPPPAPPVAPAPPPAPVASLQCSAACMPSCLPSCTQQTAQIAVPCGNPCYCQPGYVQCAETMCCLKYRNLASKFRKLKNSDKKEEIFNDNECNNNTTTIWRKLKCNTCVQDCIRKENMIYEDGPQDRGLIRSVHLCCARLVTYSQISAKLIFDFNDDPIVEHAFGVLEYRALADADDLYEPVWILSQIVRERFVNISDLKCGYLYQFRLTLVTTRIIDRRTSLWISNRNLCRY